MHWSREKKIINRQTIGSTQKEPHGVSFRFSVHTILQGLRIFLSNPIRCEGLFTSSTRNAYNYGTSGGNRMEYLERGILSDSIQGFCRKKTIAIFFSPQLKKPPKNSSSFPNKDLHLHFLIRSPYFREGVENRRNFLLHFQMWIFFFFVFWNI